MIKIYSLIFVLFLSMFNSSFGQTLETFSNIPTNSSNQYQPRSWTGDDGEIWTATNARTDQSLDGRALCTNGTTSITSSSYANGVGVLSFQYVRGFTSATPRTISLYVNGIQRDLPITVPPSSDTVSFYTKDLFIPGPVIIELRTSGGQIIIDNVSWTAASAEEVDYCNVQFPGNGNISVGSSFNVYAQVYKTGVTESAGQGTNIAGWIGYHTINSDPTDEGWTWIPANYHTDQGNNDEYIAEIGSTLVSGTYYYASRFQTDSGPFKHGGHNITGGGFWDGIYNVNGQLSVDAVDFCNLQFPGIGTIDLGNPFSVYGQVYEKDLTSLPGQGAGMEVQVGYSAANTHPNTWTNWINAAYNPACADCNADANDEYAADLGSAIPDVGVYYYAMRYRLNNGIWSYGGILADGSAGNFWDGVTYISGVLTVQGPKIKVEGNIGSFPHIPNGDVTPMGTDNTLFSAQFIGASQSKSYRIKNIGNTPLHILDLNIVGPHPGDFTIVTAPDATVLPGDHTLFEIVFSPLAAGTRNATVSIATNDPTQNPYSFAIRGNGRCVSTSNSISPSTGPAGTTATIIGSNFNTATTGYLNGLVMETRFINSTTVEVVIPVGAQTGNIVIVNALGCTGTIPFKVIDRKIGGCEGMAALSDLFISEVTDATTGGLSYIEIYNGTGSSKNIGDYAIAIYNNGSATASNTIPLNSEVILPNSTYVLAIGVVGNATASNSCVIPGGNGQFANQKSTISGINKKDNEHDVIRLMKSGVVIDQFGIYMDPNWMDATGITGDRGFNFRRLNNASPLPNPNFDNSQWNSIDWVGSGSSSCVTNDYSDIRSYDYSGGTSPLIQIQPQFSMTTCTLTAALSAIAEEGLVGGPHLTYQWFYNAPGANDWLEIESSDINYTGQQSETLHILHTAYYHHYQYYVQVREDDMSCFSASNATRLNLASTIWNGSSWNNGFPDANVMGILNASYDTSSHSGSFTACSLIINDGHTLHITDSHVVEVKHDLQLLGNSPSSFAKLMVATKGALVQRGNGSDAGKFIMGTHAQAQVNKTTALKNKWYDYTYWGSPISGATIETSLAMAPPGRRFYFDAARYEDLNGDDIDDNGDDWQLATGVMFSGVGYAATSNNSGTFPRVDATSFIGPFNTGDITVPIVTNHITTDKDFNLLGNPYPSALDFVALYNDNSDVIDGTAYLWSQALPPLATNPGNQKLNFNTADYAIITAGSGNTAGSNELIPSDYIPSGQGFFVIGKNLGGTLTFRNSMRSTDPSANSQFFRSQNTFSHNKFWINLSSDNGIFSQILVAYVPGATDAFDGFAYDAERNNSSGVSALIYTQIENSHKKYAIQGKAISSLTADEEVLVGFKSSISQPTLFRLSIARIQGDYFEEHMLYLKDQNLNSVHNLSISDYHFTSAPGDFNDRFTIFFSKQTLGLDSKYDLENECTIYELSNGNVQFSVAKKFSIEQIEILNVLGQNLYSFKGQSNSEILELPGLSQATFYSKIRLSNGKTLIKRSVKLK